MNCNQFGKIVDYNGLYGHIKSVDGKNYVVLDKDMMESNLKVEDYVEFIGENYNTVETNIDIARFVKKLFIRISLFSGTLKS